MKKNRLKRAFIVGCPRSGTTLLQSMLAAHPDVFSLPETHFFRLVTSKNRMLRLCGITTNFSTGKQNLLDLGAKPNEIPNWFNCLLIRNQIKSFTRVLDRRAFEENKCLWVEKTPSHLHFIPLIEKHVEDVKFIHIIRGGKLTISSLYEVTNRYPENWGGPRSVETCLSRWVDDLKISLKCVGKNNHFLLRYEDLIHDPKNQLQKIADFLNIEFEGEMLTRYKLSYNKIKENNATWTEGAGKDLYRKVDNKFNSVFNHDQKEFILREVIRYGFYEYL